MTPHFDHECSVITTTHVVYGYNITRWVVTNMTKIFSLSQSIVVRVGGMVLVIVAVYQSVTAPRYIYFS